MDIDYRDNSMRLTCSAGIAVCTQQDAAETLLSWADQALYMARQTGRDRAVLAAEKRPGTGGGARSSQPRTGPASPISSVFPCPDISAASKAILPGSATGLQIAPHPA